MGTDMLPTNEFGGLGSSKGSQISWSDTF